jgi:predicted permease
MHDLRTALRSLLRRPVYSVVVVVTLALGLSAAMAVFTYANGFYQPFPGVDADRLVRIFGVVDEDQFGNISFLDYLDYAAGVDETFQGLAAAQAYYAASVRHETMTEVAFLEAVTGEYFPLLDVEMAIGRGLSAQDDRADADPAAVLSYSWWQRSFGGERSVLGSTLYLNYRPFTIVGVAAPSFLGSTGDNRPDVWIPIPPFRDRYVSWAAMAENRDIPLVRVFGRLRDGVRNDQAQSELMAVATGLDEVYPGRDQARQVHFEGATWIDPRARIAEAETVRLMLIAAGGLLLLVCANVANLLLTIAIGRRQEMAMRAALGASPGRLLRQLLVENVLLSGLAGLIALLLANPLSARLGSYFARPSVWGANVAREVSVDLRVVLVAVVASVLIGVLAGALPALRAARPNLLGTLKTDDDLSAGGPRRIASWRLPGARDLLVSTQVALSVVLLVLAGLVLRTLNSAQQVDPGFSYDRLMASYISTSSTSVEPEERDLYFRELAARLSDEPWVRAATISDYAPLSGHRSAQLRLEGQSEPVSLVYSKVIPGFFQILGIDVLGGRRFSAADTVGAPEVAIVNQAVVRRYFAGEDPVGRRVWWPGPEGAEDRVFEIVGVVRDAKVMDFLAEPEPVVYFPNPQHSYASGSALLVSTTGPPATAVPQLYRWLREYEPHIAIVNVLPYSEVVRGFLYTQRMNAEMFSALAFLGLVLAAVGIFSVLSLTVSRRTREIGIRMAMGARRGRIARMVVGRALGMVGLGLVVGLSASFAVSGLVRSLLRGVEPTDPLSIAAGVAVLLAAASLAAYLPALRATTVEPVTALRCE